MGVRTLQRRLKKNGLTYKRVVDQARYQASADLLCDQHVKLIDIAYELGYSDQANFNRAFRRFVGISPGEYRLQLLEDRSIVPKSTPTQDIRASTVGKPSLPLYSNHRKPRGE
jgi:AraC-like DNA-binding protein